MMSLKLSGILNTVENDVENYKKQHRYNKYKLTLEVK